MTLKLMHKYFGFGCSILIPVIENLKSKIQNGMEEVVWN